MESALCKLRKCCSNMLWSQRLTDLCELPESTGDGTDTISDPTLHFSDSLIGTTVYPILDAK
jgi:hypothetical protein